MPKENIMRAIMQPIFKFKWQPVKENQKNPRPTLTEEDKIAKQSLFLVPSTMLFNTLGGLDVI